MVKCTAMKTAAAEVLVIEPAIKSFGQEFYPHEALRVLRAAEKIKTSDRRELMARLCQELPQRSDATRRRLAAKFIQRYLSATRSRIHPSPDQQPLVKLVARLRHTPALIQLLYYELQKTDELVGVLARELFYPVCIEGRAPHQYSQSEFAARNGNRLFSDAPLLTRPFILDHAREQWNFNDAASIDRALRVLLGAGLIARERMADLRNHPTSFYLADHEVAPATFAWALYDECLPALHNGNMMLDREEIAKAKFARTFLMEPAQVQTSLETLRRHQLIAVRGTQVRLLLGDASTLADALLSKAM